MLVDGQFEERGTRPPREYRTRCGRFPHHLAHGLQPLLLAARAKVRLPRYPATPHFGEVLAQFRRRGGTKLVLWWWIFALTAAALAPLAVLVAGALDDASGIPCSLFSAATVGVLAALVQVLGLIRWPFLVPDLARARRRPRHHPRTARSDRHRLPELQPLPGRRRRRTPRLPAHRRLDRPGRCRLVSRLRLTLGALSWLGILGIVIGAVLALCSLEFVGAFEQEGWKLAGVLTPIAYVAWSVWLLGLESPCCYRGHSGSRAAPLRSISQAIYDIRPCRRRGSTNLPGHRS